MSKTLTFPRLAASSITTLIAAATMSTASLFATGVAHADSHLVEQHVTAYCSPGGGQDCDKTASVHFDATAGQQVQIRYTPDSIGCSDAEFSFYLDGATAGNPTVAKPGQEISGVPYTIGWTGGHDASLSAKGIVGGCNTGTLEAWGGTIVVDVVSQAPGTGAQGRTDDAANAELISLVADARQNPDKYAPHGNTAGAKMDGCDNALAESPALDQVAADHNAYLATQPIATVNTFPNMHMNASGKLSWDEGGPIQQAGYESQRAEIVATGFTTAADAVRFWMQDDEASNWGHRNLILNCDLEEAGYSHLAGGDGGHYWTVDFGTK